MGQSTSLLSSLGSISSTQPDTTDLITSDKEEYVIKKPRQECKRVVYYHDPDTNQVITGLKIKKDKNHIHVSTSYNRFEKKKTQIKRSWKKIPQNKTIKKKINHHVCGTKNEPDLVTIPKELQKQKKYKIHHQYKYPYLVYLGKNTLSIYKLPTNTTLGNKDKILNGYYSKLVKKFKIQKSWVGKHTMITDEWDSKNSLGNTILAKTDKDKYLFVGKEIYEFETDDNIEKYYSMIGNNNTPYPIALGEKYVYFMLDKKYLDKSEFDDQKMNEKKWEDAYGYFYQWKNDKQKKFKKFKKVKVYDSV